jgi:predicted Rdx family selenoprotein
MELLEVLHRLTFGQRVAEDEGDELAKYFVETDHWHRLFSDSVDVVYGPKGSGKSALYSLLIARTDQLFDRRVLLAPAENPRGAPAFRDLVVDPPASEREFVSLWKLYLLCVLARTFDEYGVGGPAGERVHAALAREGLIATKKDLQGLLRSVGDYIRRALRPQAVEGNVQLDPHTGLPVGFGGKITFESPDAAGATAGATSVDELLSLCDENLAEHDYSVWLLLDRLDVAFADSQELEHNALRALFKVYLDLRALGHVGLKIFLRTDIWRRITEGGFREASHITRHMTIEWNERSLMHLVALRAAQNASLLERYGAERGAVLLSPKTQETFFYTICPNQVDVGSRKPVTFDWVLTRTRDGTGQNAPRELIHLLNCLRDEQVRRLEVGEPEPEERKLFARTAFKDALSEVSRTRLEQTLYAENPGYRDRLEELRGEKTLHSVESLARIWGIGDAVALAVARGLVDAGFFEARGTREDPEFWVPFLYRDALELVQGSAD